MNFGKISDIFIFNPRRCHKRTLEIEHFYKGHDGDFIHIKNIFFDQCSIFKYRGVRCTVYNIQ